MLSDQNFSDLKEKGYTVIEDVVSDDDCEKAIGQYQQWLSQFKDGSWPYSSNSLIQRYNTGHMEPTWSIRLKSKNVFAQVWKTDKLLSSIDAIAIGRPPEDGQERFHSLGDHWLHLDQNENRTGLHAYQGAVYLEEACEDDWTLQVIEGSHNHFEEFYSGNARATMKSNVNYFYDLLDEDVKYFEKLGCTLRRVPVPKGGMVLWDSRLVHANANPRKGRQNPGRWRYCVFVSMTPAIWASERDIRQKQKAYNQVCMTTHWSSQGVNFFKTHIPAFAPKAEYYPKEIPEIARTKEAKQLCGVIAYDFNDGRPNCEDLMPKWKEGWPIADEEYDLSTKKSLLVSLFAVATASLVGFVVSRLLR